MSDEKVVRSVYISPTAEARLRQYALENGVTKSQLISESIEQLLSKLPTDTKDIRATVTLSLDRELVSQLTSWVPNRERKAIVRDLKVLFEEFAENAFLSAFTAWAGVRLRQRSATHQKCKRIRKKK